MAKKRTEKNSKEAWRLKKKAQAQAAQAQTGRPATVDEAVDQVKHLIRDLGPEQKREVRRVLEEKLKETDPYDGKLGTPLNYKFLVDEVKAQFREQPDVRTYVSEKRETPEEQSVESYLEFLSQALRFTRENRDPERRAELMRAYVALREARVFHIGAETYGAVHQEADRHTTMLAGLPYTTVASNLEPKDSRHYLNTLMRGAKLQAYPEQFPFPSIFFGYGAGVGLQVEGNQFHIPSVIRDDVFELTLLGHLMTDDGMAYSCFKGQTSKGDSIWLDEARTEAGWPRGLGLEPWTLPHLVRIINDHRTFVIETEISGAVKASIKKNRKELGLQDYKHIPIPFYSLRLQTHVIKEKVRVQLGRPATPKRYKTDVRGHERCRIRRGPLPIAPDLATKLHERGYVIFSTNKLDEDTYRRLSERGLGFKRADEWMAVKATWVKEHMTSNDPNLPYVPAVRVAGKIRTPKKQTGAWVDDPAAR